MVFASKREAQRWVTLRAWAKEDPEHRMVLRQTPFHLPGGVKYVSDFLVFSRGDEPDAPFELLAVEDVKGMKTPLYRAKRRMVEATYPVKIVEV